MVAQCAPVAYRATIAHCATEYARPSRVTGDLHRVPMALERRAEGARPPRNLSGPHTVTHRQLWKAVQPIALADEASGGATHPESCTFQAIRQRGRSRTIPSLVGPAAERPCQ